MKITEYHAKYFAHELSILHANNGVDRLSQSLFDASVDLNPHQIDAALFALENPLNKGVVLADEVGLGKTIEAGLVLCQYWAERKRKLLIICPASLRRQWAQELLDKFNLPSQILDARTFNQLQKEGVYSPLNNKQVVIMSYHYAAKLEEQLVGHMWDLVVIDEAHKLRNAHRESNKIGQALKRALFGRKKLLLTATPLQNSLMELYGMSTLIDEHIFGDDKAFRKQYMQSDSGQAELKQRLSHFVKRTLRKNVLEYVKYTQRKAITIPFTPSDKELALYDAVSSILDKEDSYALPRRQRHLTGLILRKLLASSSFAVLNTLEVMQRRLIDLKNNKKKLSDDVLLQIIEDDDIETDYLDEEDLQAIVTEEHVGEAIDHQKLTLEIKELGAYIQQAQDIRNDEKANALLKALSLGFEQMNTMGAAQKVIIFTESKRTQAYLAAFLSEHGFKDKLVTFSGSNNHPEATRIYQQWQQTYAGSDRITGSPQVDRRTALIDYFRDSAEIMIATEAAAEGVNLQFCSLLINYDLPWNPQRVEQRIGRCHRYGQKFDVVVINFINQRNYADQRVLELLSEKFNLFDGVFGASDTVLGTLESGVDFEKRIQQIYQECRSPAEIESAFAALQKELEADINEKMQQTQQVLLEHFDEDIHDLLKIKLDQAKDRLDKVGRWFWSVTTHQLQQKALFNESDYSFMLTNSVAEQPPGKYQFIRKGDEQAQVVNKHTRVYRISHPLGEYVIDSAKAADTPLSLLKFNYQSHDGKVSVAEKLQGQAGWLSLHLLSIEAFNIEQHLVFTGVTDSGQLIDTEACKKLFNIGADATEAPALSTSPEKLREAQTRNLEAQLAIAMDTNNKYFQDERDKLDKWADDKMLAAEQALTDTKNQIKSLKRESRHAISVDEQQQFQQQLKELELKQRRLRQNIWDVEDSIAEKRDELIAALEARMKQKTDIKELFTVRWKVI
ncbi:Helicase conserved C-terminal domain-containing protein [Arsukibacterium tuosuense]|uniref:Helicase conserved C-terminal domain-containing protein n=1 Tax=Arsukibacterium tuosuense TaxID=1323745 RepID=A0A285JDT1_9GAMM|nr:SNF2-related protein [Arsukibacterium tuosuense]SNY58450.1 Helicase conserved C-terminal domain-containing protein [Arsukibacterium tuosuense]